MQVRGRAFHAGGTRGKAEERKSVPGVYAMATKRMDFKCALLPVLCLRRRFSLLFRAILDRA